MWLRIGGFQGSQHDKGAHRTQENSLLIIANLLQRHFKGSKAANKQPDEEIHRTSSGFQDLNF